MNESSELTCGIRLEKKGKEYSSAGKVSSFLGNRIGVCLVVGASIHHLAVKCKVAAIFVDWAINICDSENLTKKINGIYSGVQGKQLHFSLIDGIRCQVIVTSNPQCMPNKDMKELYFLGYAYAACRSEPRSLSQQTWARGIHRSTPKPAVQTAL